MSTMLILDRMDKYPNKIFIVITPPPEIPFDTDSDAAARARAFADWLGSDEYLSGHPNVFTLNFFDLLADPSNNMLRAEYRRDEYDTHPNDLAKQIIGPIFAYFIDRAVRTYAGTVEPGSTFEPTSVAPCPTASAAITMSTELIHPTDLAYLDAFRLSEGSGGSSLTDVPWQHAEISTRISQNLIHGNPIAYQYFNIPVSFLQWRFSAFKKRKSFFLSAG